MKDYWFTLGKVLINFCLCSFFCPLYVLISDRELRVNTLSGIKKGISKLYKLMSRDSGRLLVTVQPGADLLRNWASFACKLPNSNPVLVFFTVCTAECADLPELL